MKYFIDANIFLRVLTGDQKKQFNECRAFLQKVKENKIEAYTSNIILAEIVWTLGSYYSFSKDKITQAVKSILNLSGLKFIDSYDSLKALEFYVKYSIKYIDALIVSDGEILEKNVTVVTYDKDFAKLPILSKEPKEVN